MNEDRQKIFERLKKEYEDSSRIFAPREFKSLYPKEDLSFGDPDLNEPFNPAVTEPYIREALDRLRAMSGVAFLVIRAPRGTGKSYTSLKLLDEIANTERISIYLAGLSLKSLVRNMEQSEYKGFDDPSRYKFKTNTNTYINYSNDSHIMLLGTANARTIKYNRGTHTDMGYFDEAQECPGATYMKIFSHIGETKECKHILTATGAANADSAPAVVEKQIKEKNLKGLVYRFNPYLIYKANPCLERYQTILENEKKYTVTKTQKTAQGKTEEVIDLHFTENPDFWREQFGYDTDEAFDGDICFPSWQDSFIKSQDEFKLNMREPIIVIWDSGSSDPYCANFYQVYQRKIWQFGEMYKDYAHRDQITFKNDLLEYLEYLDIPVDHPYIYWYGDHHGHTNWNRSVGALLGIGEDTVLDVGIAQEGIDLFNSVLRQDLFRITDNCTKSIQAIPIIRNKFNKKTSRIEMDHNKSHCVVPSCYLVQTGDVPISQEEMNAQYPEEKEAKKKEFLRQETKESVAQERYIALNQSRRERGLDRDMDIVLVEKDDTLQSLDDIF